MGPKSNDRCPSKRQKRNNTAKRKGHVRKEPQIGGVCVTKKGTLPADPQNLEEARKGSPPRASKGNAALLASRTGRDYVSVVLSPHVCGGVFQKPQETHTSSYTTFSFHWILSIFSAFIFTEEERKTQRSKVTPVSQFVGDRAELSNKAQVEQHLRRSSLKPGFAPSPGEAPGTQTL